MNFQDGCKCEKQYSAKSSVLHTPWVHWRSQNAWFMMPKSRDLTLTFRTRGLLGCFFFKSSFICLSSDELTSNIQSGSSSSSKYIRVWRRTRPCVGASGDRRNSALCRSKPRPVPMALMKLSFKALIQKQIK